MKKYSKYLIIIFVLVLLYFLIGIYIILKDISIRTNRSITYFPSLLLKTKSNPSIGNSLDFIILGLDPRNDLLEKTITTDTIIYGNLKHNSSINLISIPRDLWDYQLSVKINQIYPLSQDYLDKFAFIQNNYSRITGQNISRTIVFTTQNLIDIINLMGGVDINLPQGFTDNYYPNPDYIANPNSSIPKYKTVQFPSGKIHLDKNNVTEFVRSRKSSESVESGGTDIGRIKRQQLLLESILSKLSSRELLNNYKFLADLYNYWQDHITSNLSDSDILELILKNYKNLKNMPVISGIVPTAEEPNKDVLYHPIKFINNQWVFIPDDNNYSSLKLFIAKIVNTVK